MSYWKHKVVPKFKKLFDNKGKKKVASEATKTFDSSKESLDKDVEEKRSDLHPKVLEIYKSATVISKKLLKEPSEKTVKEHADATQTLLGDLAKAGFPQAQFLSDAASKSGPALLPGPIVYLFQKTSTFLVDEPLPEEHATREIVIEGGTASTTEETKEPAAKDEKAPPTEKVEPSEEKKEVVPVKAEEAAAAEAKKGDADAVEAKKEVVAQVKEEVETVKAAVEATAGKPAPKEEAREVTPVKEVKKEEAVKASPSETKKEDAPKVEEKKEKPADIPPSAGEKK